MAGLVLGVVGAAIGAGFAGFAGMSGASLGFSLGSMLGNTLFAPSMPNINQQGPRLGDLKVQSSTYGNPIPIVYGAMRVAGNVIWSMDVAETPHTTTQSGGGKGGGGGGSVTQTSYTYSQSFAIALCEGTIVGVRKIWANGKLIYNLSDTADIATIVASNKSASGIHIYTGSETQTADSLIQANIGAADTPAYRGVAYVVFESLQLADFGNQAPNLEFEVVKSGSISPSLTLQCSTPAPGNSSAIGGSFIYAVGHAVLTLKTYNISNPSVMTLTSSVDTLSGGGAIYSYDHALLLNGKLYLATQNGFQIFSLGSPSIPRFINKNAAVTAGMTRVLAGNATYVYTLASGFCKVLNAASGDLVATISTLSPGCVAADSQYLYAFNTITNNIEIYNVNSNSLVGACPPGGIISSICVNGNYIYVTDATNNLMRIIDVSNHTSPTVIGSIATGIYPYSITVSGNYAFVTNYTTSSVQVFDVAAPSSPTLLASASTATSPVFCSVSSRLLYISCSSGYVQTFFLNTVPITQSTTTLSTIVSDICMRAGLTAGQIDVTALTDTVDGYVVQRCTARSQIEQLMQAFYFDAVESDGKIKFVKRGGAAVLNIPEDDLAAHAYGSTMPDNLVTTRKQEMELPLEFNVQYMDRSAAYLVNSQRSKRLTTSSQNKVSVNLAIAMAATKAKQISDVLMYDAWTGRTSFSFSTGWKYSYLEPTDVITVTKGSSTYTVRVASDDLNVGISGRTAVLEDNTVYTQTAAAVEAPAPINTVSTVPLTDLLLLDIPLLRDQDDAVGFYAAACGYGSGWKGAQGFKSNDGSATWNSYGNAFLNAASIGTASGVLGTFSSGNIFDETNTVSVVLINGTLSSDTELNVLNGANVALLGNEIIQFKNATLTATSTYTLSGLLRGRQGTEWAMTTHAAGDRFVLLSSTTTYLFPASSAEYNLARKYRGVSIGGFLADATTIDFTNTAAAQKPLSPVQIGGGRNAALDITLNWTRRTRIGGGWGDFSDVPLGEASESYSIDIMQGATVKRTLTSATPTVQYTSAQQVTDFGGNQASLLVNVYQISATVGRGFVGIATV